MSRNSYNIVQILLIHTDFRVNQLIELKIVIENSHGILMNKFRGSHITQ